MNGIKTKWIVSLKIMSKYRKQKLWFIYVKNNIIQVYVTDDEREEYFYDL